MKKLNTKLIAVALAVFYIFGSAGFSIAATTIDLGTADNFAILAGAAITNTGTSVVSGGDLGSTTLTGFPPGTTNGIMHTGDGVMTQGQTYLIAAYNNALGQVPVTTVPTELGGTTKLPGIYNSASGTFGITGILTLDAQNDPNAVFIFKTGTTLITAGSSRVVLINGAQACHVFWQVGSSATLGTSSIFKGNILALTSITLTTAANVEGRLLARNGSVTLDTNVVNKATCAVVSSGHGGTINVVKIVINDNGGTKTISDFPLFVNGTSVTSGVTGAFTAPAAAYTITETNNSNYVQSFSGDCDIDGHLSLNPGENKFCIITNDDIGTPTIVPPTPPLIDVVKVPNPLSLPDGPGLVTYTYTLRNIGKVPVSDISMVGDTCSPIVLVSGDTNSDNKLDLNEVWVHRCSTTLSETHTNIVTATGWANGLSVSDVASATVIVGIPIVPPLIHVTKIPDPMVLLAGGGMVNYIEQITNPGTVPLNNVLLTDDKCAPVVFISGDSNNDSRLDPSETWTYACRTGLTKTTTNTAIVSGEANGLTVRDIAVATVVVATAVPLLPQTGFPLKESNNWFVIISSIFVLTSIALVLISRKRKA